MERNKPDLRAVDSLPPPEGQRALIGTVDTVGTESVYVAIGTANDRQRIRCRVLQSSQLPVRLSPGDQVLVAVYEELGFFILGRVLGNEVGADTSPSHGASALPDTLVLEATDDLTLRVGEGSVTIRKDGKILIKGTDLVSHAQRMNRIKGGSVSIN